MKNSNKDKRLYEIYINDAIRKRTRKLATVQFYTNLQKPIIKEDDDLIS